MPQITFLGVMTATTADYMSYMIWRRVLLHDMSRDVTPLGCSYTKRLTRNMLTYRNSSQKTPQRVQSV